MRAVSDEHAEQYVRIFGHAGPNMPSGARIRIGRARKRDSKNIRSESAGCHPAQVEDFNRQFGDLGVRFDPDGTAVFADRSAKKRALRAMGMFDRDEVWSPRNA